jgi:hypothetical protein
MAPSERAWPAALLPPQMNTLEPIAVYAAFSRFAKPTSGFGMVTHLGVQLLEAQLRPSPHLLPQPLQLLASEVGSMHFCPHAILGGTHVSVMHWLPLHTLLSVQSPSPQHSKQPVPAQHLPPPAQVAPELHTPLLQMSAVQELPSLH